MTPIESLQFHAESRPKSVAFVKGEKIVNYETMATEVERLARGLADHGVRKGDRVALHMANTPEMTIAYHACFRLGAIAAPLNIRLKNAELTALLARLRPSLYIGQVDLYSHVASVDSSILPSNRRFLANGIDGPSGTQPWTNLLASDLGGPSLPVPDADAPALLLATSGTTGQPKFVVHTLTTLSEMGAFFRHLLVDEDQLLVAALPMAHMSGVSVLVAAIHFGAPFVLYERFDADVVLDGIERYGCTWLAGLPVMFVELLERQRVARRDVSSLKACVTAGDVCPPDLQRGFSKLFGIQLRSFWASTEAIGNFTYGLQPGAVSRVIRRADVRVVDDFNVPVTRGRVGELVLRGSHVTPGYWIGPGVIEDPRRGGWFHTGDLVRQGDHDDIWFEARGKDIIKRGGANISPVEVERVLLSVIGVDDAAVFGMPDPVLGQRVFALVKLVPGAPRVGVDEILARVRPQLADYKIPERLRIVDKIPRNNLGKIDRRSLLSLTTTNEHETHFDPVTSHTAI